MNDTPTSGPIASSITHHDFDAASSRRSLSSSHTNADLRERKEDLLEIRGRRRAARGGERRQLGGRPLAADAAGAQEHETVADASGVGDLVNREKERASGGGVRAERARDVARLSQIQAVERLVGEQPRP